MKSIARDKRHQHWMGATAEPFYGLMITQKTKTKKTPRKTVTHDLTCENISICSMEFILSC